jgi:hypothetical protein
MSKEKLYDATSRHAGGKRPYFDRGKPLAPGDFIARLRGEERSHLSEEDIGVLNPLNWKRYVSSSAISVVSSSSSRDAA